MKRNIFIILLFTLALTSAFADVVEIGDGTNTTSYIPVYGYYNYGWSHFILPGDNIQSPMVIDQLGFNVSNAPSNYVTNNQTVHMRLTTESTISNEYLVNPLADGYTEVFTGNITWDGSGWQGFELTDPFDYDGTSNLEIIWENRDGSYASGYPQFYTTQTNSAGAYNYSDGSFPVSTGSSASYYPNTRIDGVFEVSSITPESNATNVSVTPTISFEVIEGFVSYELYFDDEPNPEVAIIPFSQVTNPISYTFVDPLEFLTDYYWTVVLYDIDYEVTTLNFTFKTKPPFDGSGTEDNPYQIDNLSNLIAIGEYNELWDAFFIQTSNIDASSTSALNEGLGFTPIGVNSDNLFSGSYDGNDFTITNLHINRPSTDYVGMFGYIHEANIINVGLVDNEVIGNQYIGGLIGYSSCSSINNCYANGNVNGTSTHVGGLIGYYFSSNNSSNTVSNCYTTGNVSGISSYIGGLIGSSSSSSSSNYSSNTTIVSNCYATGTVSGASYVGGLIGSASSNTSVSNTHDSSSITISNCYATGTVNGTSNYVGGLVGYSYCYGEYISSSFFIISNSYATGSVNGNNNVGGLVGHSSSHASSQPISSAASTISNCYAAGSVNGTANIGGLIGYSSSTAYHNSANPSYSSSTISNCYATGFISGSSQAGGLVGYGSANYTDDYIITNSFWDIETSNQTISAGGTGKVTQEMKSLYTYLHAGWDFLDEDINGTDDIWYIHPSLNNGYPYIVSEEQFSFTNLPNCTATSYPKDGETNLATSDNLVWRPDFFELTLGYRISLGTDTPPTNIVNNQDLGLTIFYDYNNLATNTNYYWQVIPYNENGDAEDCPIWSFNTGSAGIITLGSGVNTDTPLPINFNYKKSYSQSIYLQTELNIANRDIEKLSFYIIEGASFVGSNGLKIYLGHTDKTEFSASNDWLLTNQGLTQVADVTLPNILSAGWLDIELETPFTYNNTDNLILGVIEYSSEISEQPINIYTVDTNANRTLSFGHDSITPNPNIPYGGVILTSIPKINFMTNAIPTIELPESFTFEEDGELIIDMSEYAEDIGGDPFTLTVSGNENIFVQMSGLMVTLSATPNWFGTEELTFTVDDDIVRGLKSEDKERATASSTVNIIVTPVNDAPTIELPASFTFAEDGELVIDMSQYAEDVDGDSLTLTVSGNQNVSVEISGLMVTMNAVPDWHGTEQLTFMVNDGVTRVVRSTKSESVSKSRSQSQSKNRATGSDTVNIIVTPVNDAPTITLPASFTFEEDGELVVDMSQYTEDVDEDPLTLTASGNQNVFVEISGLMVTLNAAPNWFGTEQLTFTINDGVTRNMKSMDRERVTASASVNIIVTPVNDAPTITLPASFTFAEDGELIVDMSQYTEDVDGDSLTLTVSGNQDVSVGINGLMVTLNATPDWHGTEQLTFMVNDGVTRAIKSAGSRSRATGSDTVNIIVTPVNDAPTIALPTSFTFAEDGIFIIDISQYAEDVDGDLLTVTVTGQETVTVSVSGMEITLGTVVNWFGTEVLTVTVNDNSGRAIASDTTEIIVTPVNDIPTITLPVSFTFEENGELIVDMSQYTDDVDGDPLTLTVSGSENISVEISELMVTMSATQDWFGTEQLTFTIDDGIVRSVRENGRATAFGSVDIIVTHVNNVPTIELPESFTFTEDGELIIDFSEYTNDFDADPLTLIATGNENTIVNISGLLVTFSATANWFGTEQLTFTVDDGVTRNLKSNDRATASATVNIIVTPVNDAPTITLPTSFTFGENGELIVDMSQYTEDVDGNPLTLTVSGNENISAEISELMVTLSATPYWFGTEQITFTVDDGVTRSVKNSGRATASGTVNIIVTHVNNSPTIELPESFTFEEDGELMIDISEYADDIDGDELTITVTGQENMTVSIIGMEITLGVASDWFGTEQLTVTVNDNNGRALASDLTEIIVTPVNDAPTIISFNPSETELNTTLNSTINFSVEVEDIDSELTYSWFINEVGQDNDTAQFTYHFTESLNYQITVVASDEEYSVEQTWEVVVPVSNDDGPIAPVVTGIMSNYPNPFNPHTTIQYNLHKASFVDITIYNIKGKVIRKLHNAYNNAGQHSITWDGLNDHKRDVASGIYYVRMNCAERTFTHKITLLK